MISAISVALVPIGWWWAADRSASNTHEASLREIRREGYNGLLTAADSCADVPDEPAIKDGYEAVLAGREAPPAAFEPAEVKDACAQRLESALSPVRLLLSEDDSVDAEILQAARELTDSAELFLHAQIDVLAFPDERDRARTNQETYEQAKAEFESVAGRDTRTRDGRDVWVIVRVLISLAGVAGLGYLLWRWPRRPRPSKPPEPALSEQTEPELTTREPQPAEQRAPEELAD